MEEVLSPATRAHLEEDCWCCPELYYKDAETGNEVWLHKRPN